MEELKAIVDHLLYDSPNGGNWTNESGIYYFQSQLEAFQARAAHLEAGNSWNKHGFAASYASAVATFNDAHIPGNNGEDFAKQRYLTIGSGAGVNPTVFADGGGSNDEIIAQAIRDARLGRKKVEGANKEGMSGDFLLAKLWLHSQFGREKSLTIDASTLDFSDTNQRVLGLTGMKPNDQADINLFSSGINSKSLAFGKLKVTYLGNNEYSIMMNRFDWDINRDQYGNPIHTARNAGTAVGWWSTHLLPVAWILGGDFDIHFKGKIRIPK